MGFLDKLEMTVGFAQTPMGIAENMEKIEAIRYLENGKKMKMVHTTTVGIRIDTPEDFKNAERYLEEAKRYKK